MIGRCPSNWQDGYAGRGTRSDLLRPGDEHLGELADFEHGQTRRGAASTWNVANAGTAIRRAEQQRRLGPVAHDVGDDASSLRSGVPEVDIVEMGVDRSGFAVVVTAIANRVWRAALRADAASAREADAFVGAFQHDPME